MYLVSWERRDMTGRLHTTQGELKEIQRCYRAMASNPNLKGIRIEEVCPQSDHPGGLEYAKIIPRTDPRHPLYKATKE